MAFVVTPPQRKKQEATETVSEMMCRVRERANQICLELAQLDRDIWALGQQANRAIELTDPTPPANVVRFPPRRDAA